MSKYFSTDISTYISQPGSIQKITIKPQSVNDSEIITRRSALRISVSGYEDKFVILRQLNANTPIG